MRSLSQSVRKWRKIYLSLFIVQCRGLSPLPTIYSTIILTFRQNIGKKIRSSRTAYNAPSHYRWSWTFDLHVGAQMRNICLEIKLTFFVFAILYCMLSDGRQLNCPYWHIWPSRIDIHNQLYIMPSSWHWKDNNRLPNCQCVCDTRGIDGRPETMTCSCRPWLWLYCTSSCSYHHEKWDFYKNINFYLYFIFHELSSWKIKYK